MVAQKSPRNSPFSSSLGFFPRSPTGGEGFVNRCVICLRKEKSCHRAMRQAPNSKFCSPSPLPSSGQRKACLRPAVSISSGAVAGGRLAGALGGIFTAHTTFGVGAKAASNAKRWCLPRTCRPSLRRSRSGGLAGRPRVSGQPCERSAPEHCDRFTTT